jgi:aldehyde dehydrogenase (NAD+)
MLQHIADPIPSNFKDQVLSRVRWLIHKLVVYSMIDHSITCTATLKNIQIRRMTQYTSKTEFEEAYSTLFQTFDTGITKSIRWRKWQLKQCWWMVHDNEAQLIEALKEDLGRHDYEAYFGDILSTKSDILDHIKNVEKWAADEIPDAGFIMGTIGKARVRREPLGVVLVIGPWNFPISLILLPIIAAIAAGNCVLMKASEMAKASQAILSDLIPKYLDQRAIRIISGGPQETGYILDHKFNHIFFTGSSKVARFVTAAAAKHLTPVVLELGGQGPAIVTKNANIDLAAKRIAYSKFLNCGQICLSVNHVYADPAIYDKFTERLAHWAEQFMAKGDSHFSRIINSRNFDRLVGLLKGTQGVVSYGGGSNRATNFLALTVVKDIKQDGKLPA